MKVIHLEDYKQLSHSIINCDLTIEILKDCIEVSSKLVLKRNNDVSNEKVFFNGVELELLEIKINDESVKKDEDYTLEKDGLCLNKIYEDFTLFTKVKIDPFNNLSGEGIYKSSQIICSQCEAEGFRKITYFFDRPDNLSKFTTKVIGDKNKYPSLLSNGNLIESGDLADGKHFCTWVDPFAKPSYLFALVAGEFDLVSGTFKAKDGRDILLEIYVDPGNADKCDFALESLKNSMKWDEERFDLVYDLDRYMIVAVDSFNMGAMENKGLNIFNSAYVLAKKETATDSDFKGVEAVIGHEYFHNWTGNRVTCRDWFQLTLKEGLTVFRDQEFSSDMGSRSVKRIEDVKLLWNHQFPEDAGPLSHPIKPKKYSEINNFYTATVYDKGAEVIRMIHTLIGEENFQKGMKIYFEKFDGMAVTTEDFVDSMAQASGKDLSQFKLWYDQNGTPVVDIKHELNDGVYKITFKQSTNLNNNKFDALHFPFYFELYSADGKFLERVELELNSKEQIYEIKLNEMPIPSWNTNYCAPVKVNFEYSTDQLAILSKYSRDDFNRYNSFQDFFVYEIERIAKLIKEGRDNQELSLDSLFISSFKEILENDQLDFHFRSYILSAPSLSELNSRKDKYEIESLDKAISFLENEIYQSLGESLSGLLSLLDSKLKEYQFNDMAIGARSLRSVIISYLTSVEVDKDIYERFSLADNMTDSISLLGILVKRNNTFKAMALSEFYNQWKNEPLVIQKWFSLQALAGDVSVDELIKLENDPVFDIKVPNFVRSLYGSFSRNIKQLNSIDGSGYKFLKDRILKIDKFNPQIASRLAKSLTHSEKLDDKRKAKLLEELSLLKKEKLSGDVTEIINLSLNK